MTWLKIATFALALIGVVFAGCDKALNPLSSNSAATYDGDEQLRALLGASWTDAIISTPAPLVTVNFGPSNIEIWPYTGENFYGIPQDPINVIFFGQADPRQIRAALLSVDGNRTAFGLPDLPPFNSTWHDAIGDVQTGYGSDDGWTGGVVQLACGDFGPLRYHLRLFRIGEWTVGNAHFELLIPGTTTHQVISWKCAADLVYLDMLRSGLLDTEVPVSVAEINEAEFRTIPGIIYNGLPVEIRGYIEGPLGDVGEEEEVPIKNSLAYIFNVAGAAPIEAGTYIEDFPVEFDIVMPKPFCWTSPYDFVEVKGPVNLYQVTEINGDGDYSFSFQAEGELQVVPIDLSTGLPGPDTLRALVQEHHDGFLTDRSFAASSWLYQKLLPSSDPASGKLFVRLRVASDGINGYQIDVDCPEETDWFAQE